MSLLLTVTGRDHPGVTAALFDVLTAHGASVSDVEQVVAHERLLLGVVIAGPGDGRAVRAAVSARAAELDVEVEFTALEGDEHPAPGPRHHVTVLGAPLQPAAFAGVVELAGADSGGAVDTRETAAREASLRELARLVRRARVAAWNAYGQGT